MNSKIKVKLLLIYYFIISFDHKVIFLLERDNDISRAMNQFIEKNTPKNCIDLIPRKELVNDILRTSTNAAEFKQPIGADSTYHILQQSREYLTKMDSPKAAELTETTSIQYKK